MKAIKEIIFWTLALIFAGIMVVGAIAYFDVRPWAAPLINLSLFCGGFIGCAWASNKTALGRRIGGNQF